MVTAFRVLALACGLFYLSAGWIWAYGLALVVLPFGVLGLVLGKLAEKREEKLGRRLTSGQRLLHNAARLTCVAGFVVSFIALVMTR